MSDSVVDLPVHQTNLSVSLKPRNRSTSYEIWMQLRWKVSACIRQLLRTINKLFWTEMGDAGVNWSCGCGCVLNQTLSTSSIPVNHHSQMLFYTSGACTIYFELFIIYFIIYWCLDRWKHLPNFHKMSRANERRNKISSIHIIFIYPAILSPSLKLSFADLFAFRLSGSTRAALIYLLEKINHLLETNTHVFVYAFDFSKAFDTVKKSTLFEKFANLPLPAHIHNWLADFFSNRLHCTSLDGLVSQLKEITTSIIYYPRIWTRPSSLLRQCVGHTPGQYF